MANSAASLRTRLFQPGGGNIGHYMKTRAMQSWVAAGATLAFGWGVMGQGLFTFTNAQPPKGSPLVGCDGKPVSGPDYRVDVAAHNPATGAWDDGVETPGKNGSWTKLGPLPLLEGKLPGYFQGGTVRVPFVAPGQEARLRIRAWLATGGVGYDQAKVRFETNMVVMLGGVGQPPSFPARLRNFPTLRLCP